MPVLQAMFFDIGWTLGEIEPTSLKLRIFPDTVSILAAIRALGFRLGVITNVTNNVNKDRVRTMLAEASIAHYFEGGTIITSTEAGSFKPETAIFLFAARAIHLPVERCVYVDENRVQVAAAVTAGMHGILWSDRRSFRLEKLAKQMNDAAITPATTL
jgi:putative hydrolase of the HAD superfamily